MTFTIKALLNQLFNSALHHFWCSLSTFGGLDFLILRKGPPIHFTSLHFIVSML